MVRYEDRIRRMQESGILTAAQAGDMLASLQGGMNMNVSEGISGDGALCFRKKIPLGLVAGAVAFVAVAALMWGGGGSGAEQEVVQNVSEILNKSGETGEMNKNFASIISIFVVLVPIVLVIMWLYNDLVGKEENVMQSWSQVESNYQRRVDLIPNLVKTVKTYMEHESKVMGDVTEARTGQKSSGDLAAALAAVEAAHEKADGLAKGAADKLGDDAYMRDLAIAQKSVGDGIGRLFGVAENYPNLRSADNFLALQSQMEGTENRINVARMVFNDAVGDYNAAIRKMPGSLIAGMGDFKRKAYFKSDEGADKAIGVNF
jgi:LemA protein